MTSLEKPSIAEFYFISVCLFLINIFKIRLGWNREVDGQTIHITDVLEQLEEIKDFDIL